MPISAAVANTPYYVLMDGNLPIGPEVMPLPSGIECSPVYGFSNKRAFDRFSKNHLPGLKPYPLVKGYVRNQIAAPGDGLKLVALDAAGPDEPDLQAATMEMVLEVLENRATRVTAAYQLHFDQEANAYRIEEAAV